jgi:chemotaxis protein MotB
MTKIATRSLVRSPWRLIPLVAVAAAQLGCGVDDQIHQAALRDLDEQRQLASQGQKAIADQDAEIKRLKHQLGALEEDRRKSGAALDEAKKSMDEMARARTQAEARAAQFRSLVAQFRKMTESGKLKVEIRDNRMIVSLGDRILFDPGRAELKRDGADTLKQVTAVLKEVGARDFQVAGHTDNAPIRSSRYRSNWDLSSARAVEVVNFMIANGMESKRLSAAGYADQDPVASNESADGKAKNRRIEITLMPNLEDLPPITADATGDAATAAGKVAVPPPAQGKMSTARPLPSAGAAGVARMQAEKDKDGTAAMPKNAPPESPAPIHKASAAPTTAPSPATPSVTPAAPKAASSGSEQRTPK